MEEVTGSKKASKGIKHWEKTRDPAFQVFLWHSPPLSSSLSSRTSTFCPLYLSITQTHVFTTHDLSHSRYGETRLTSPQLWQILQDPGTLQSIPAKNEGAACVLPVLRTTRGHQGWDTMIGQAWAWSLHLQPAGAEYCDPEPSGTNKYGVAPQRQRHVADTPHVPAGRFLGCQ